MVKSQLYVPRTYRHRIKDLDLVSFTITVSESDLYIKAVTNLHDKALRITKKYRQQLETYIERNSLFLTSLEPIAVENDAPVIAKAMAAAAVKVGVGPMAAVAGAIAEFVGRELLEYSPEIIIENGGDIFLKSKRRRIIGIYAGDSPLSGKINLEISGDETPMGICTSSGTVGHSLSFGNTDAAVVLSNSAILADAAATAIVNIVKTPENIEEAITFARRVSDIKGIVVIIGDKLGIWGNIKLV
jgi:ApbE superfamily uncharacterized protein (UPF0280 family)